MFFVFFFIHPSPIPGTIHEREREREKKKKAPLLQAKNKLQTSVSWVLEAMDWTEAEYLSPTASLADNLSTPYLLCVAPQE